MTIDPQIPVLISAVGAFVLGILNVFRSKKIYHLVNSEMTKVRAELATAKLEIDGLRGTIVKLDTALRERVTGD